MSETRHVVRVEDGDLDKIIAKMRQFGKETDISEKKIDEIEKSLKGVNQQGNGVNNLNKNFQGLSNTMDGLVQSMLAFVAIDRLKQLGSAIIDVTAEFGKLRAAIRNSLGSDSEGDLAFARISNFAAKTPFQIGALTESFIKLTQRGFIPTNRELTKLGDLASSQVKSFDQLVEALLDAQTGEFERLKEFGVRARQEGDQVSFTFRGVTTTVEKTDEAIKSYILSLGELEGISGSMAVVSETLSGKLSNLDDSLDRLFDNIGSANTGVLTDFIDLIAEAADGLSDLIQSSSARFNQNLAKYLEETTNALEDLNDQAAIDEKIKEYSKSISELTEELDALQAAQAAYGNEKSFLDRFADNTFPKNTITDTQKYKEAISDLEAKIRAYQKAVESAKGIKVVDEEEPVAALGIIERLSLQIKELKELRDKSRSQSEIQSYNERIALAEEEIKRLRDLGERKKLDDVKLLDADKYYNSEAEREQDKSLKRRESRMKEYAAFVVRSNAEKIKELEKQEEDRAAFMEDMQAQAYFVGSNFVDALFNREIELGNQKLMEVERQRAQDVAYAGDNAKKIEEINRNAAQKEEAIRRDQVAAQRKQAMFNRGLALFEIFNSARAAFMKSVELFPLTGGQPWAGIAIALGALQAGAVLAQPLPKYAKGKFKLDGPGTKTSDSITARLSKGESVTPAHVTDKFGWLLKPMIEKPNFGQADLRSLVDEHVPLQLRGDLFKSGKSSPIDYDKLAGKIAGPVVNAIKNKEEIALRFDREGFTTSIIRKDKETEILNNRY